jgi:spore germination protein YaaH
MPQLREDRDTLTEGTWLWWTCRYRNACRIPIHGVRHVLFSTGEVERLDTAIVPPPRRKRRGRGWALLFLFMVTVSVVTAWTLWYSKTYGPVDTWMEPDYGADKPIFYNGSLLEGSAIGEGEGLKLPLTLIQEIVDPNIVYEKETNSIIITTDRQLVRLVTDQLTGWLNDKPFELRFPIEVLDGVVYVPTDPLERFYGISFEDTAAPARIVMRKPGDVIAWAVVPATAAGNKPEAAAIRQEPSIRSPIVAELTPEARVSVWGEEDGWYRVQHANGIIGFADKRALQWSGTEVYAAPPLERREPYRPTRPMGERVVLTWEQVYTKNPNPANFDPMPGLNVVSPTWFHLLDGKGALKNLADPAYVAWAHKQGMQVWALFSNNFEPDLTSEALATYDNRMSMARQLLSWAQLYELDGINVDFENVHLKDGPKLTQFIRELGPLMREAGLTLSIDVTFISTNENWSLFYDRRALGKVVDYMMVMAYDEHWASSPKAGSVASLPWVERGVRRIIEEHDVPAEKIVLGVPFYTRVWTEETVDGKKKVSSKAIGMDRVQQLLKDKALTPEFDETTGQHYVQYEEAGAVKKIWIEDATSIKARAVLVDKLGLAGLASWSRNFANEGIWKTIDEVLNRDS